MEAPATEPVFELRDAVIGSLHHPSVLVLEEVNWKVLAGEYWAVGGQHGSGKNSLLTTIAGLQAPKTGEVRLFGAAAGQDLAGHRLRIGLVFEHGGRMFSNMTVAQNIALPLQYHYDLRESELQEQVETVLKAMELGSLAQHTPSMLNLSWQHRVGLARALSLRPEVLFLENPLLGLEPLHRRWWLDFLDRLNAGKTVFSEKPVTLVVTTHEFHSWQGRARQFAVLSQKRFHALGTEADLPSAHSLLHELGIHDFTTTQTKP